MKKGRPSLTRAAPASYIKRARLASSRAPAWRVRFSSSTAMRADPATGTPAGPGPGANTACPRPRRERRRWW
ncbi:hypothetical protein G6F68_021523 [Rhizopus microsporus]|nr:hypothetical protein G6F68_021523 [Rhizopus microsporus]